MTTSALEGRLQSVLGPLLRWSGSLAVGLLSGMLVILTLAILSGLTLTQDRLVRVAQDALASGELAFNEHREEDYFTECSFLTMHYFRSGGVFRNAIETRFLTEAMHPCQDLEALVTTGTLPSGKRPAPSPYVNYPFGSRYLEALVLGLLDLRSAKILYATLSYASVLILFAGAFRNSTATAMTVLPIGCFLLAGFAMHRFGHNLAHAPGFFVGFAALGVFLAAREHFRDPMTRVMFFAFLGVLVAFFDLMHGSIPVVLSLTIVLNHLFYIAPVARAGDHQSPRGYWRLALQQALLIAVCFFVSYAVLTVVRLWLLSLLVDGGWHRYAAQLGVRLGDHIPGRVIQFTDVAQQLWLARYQLAARGLEAATLEMFLALAAWIFALCLVPVASWGRASPALLLALTDVAVVTLASAGVLAWYRLFMQHTYVHVLFIVRIVALPASYGFVAAALLVRFLVSARERSIQWTIVGGAVISLVTAAYVMEGGTAIVTGARFVDEPAMDSVACAPLGFRSDGKRDGLVEVSLVTRQVSPPLGLIGVAPLTYEPLSLRLERADPPGWWDTGVQGYILGISREPNGVLMNRPDGTISLPPGHLTRLWAYFCKDDHDTPKSAYMLRAGESSVPVPDQR